MSSTSPSRPLREGKDAYSTFVDDTSRLMTEDLFGEIAQPWSTLAFTQGLKLEAHHRLLNIRGAYVAMRVEVHVGAADSCPQPRVDDNHNRQRSELKLDLDGIQEIRPYRSF